MVLTRYSGRGKTSGMQVKEITTTGANLLRVPTARSSASSAIGTVSALADLGLKERAVSHADVELVRRILAPFETGDIIPLYRDDELSASPVAAAGLFFTDDFESVFVREDVGRAAYAGLAEIDFLGAPVWAVRDGRVARIEFYWNRAKGLAAAGLEV